jgi:hypothetical protein
MSRTVTVTVTGSRMPPLLPLLRPVARGVSWGTVLGAGAVGAALAALPPVFGLEMSESGLLILLRCTALASAFGVAFALDDPAAPSTVAVPVRRIVLVGLRVLLVLPVASALWAVGLLLASRGPGAGVLLAWIPVAGLLVEVLTLLLLALLVAAIRSRAGDGDAARPGMFAAGTLAVLAVAAALLPAAVRPFVPPPSASPGAGDGGRWVSAHHWWLMVALAALAGLGRATRAPLRRGGLRWRKGNLRRGNLRTRRPRLPS